MTSLTFIPPLLNKSLDIKFNSSSTIGSIMKEGFIDNLTVKTSYSVYFNMCAPSNCTYSIQGRQNIIIIVTTVIAVIGGFVTIYKLLTPALVNLVYWFWAHRQGMRNNKY